MSTVVPGIAAIVLIFILTIILGFSLQITVARDKIADLEKQFKNQR